MYQLRNELRSGLRELDAVRGELAMASSSHGIIGREFGRTGRLSPPSTSKSISSSVSMPNSNNITTTTAGMSNQISQLSAATAINPSSSSSSPEINIPKTISTIPSLLASKSRSIAAVAEEEWPNQGIGFRSRAEIGINNKHDNSGSMILADVIKESLIYDQYQRVVTEQDDILKSKMDDIVNKKFESTDTDSQK